MSVCRVTGNSIGAKPDQRVGDRVVAAVCHAADETPIAVDADGVERRFQTPELGKRSQKGRKALKRFQPVDLLPRH